MFVAEPAFKADIYFIKAQDYTYSVDIAAAIESLRGIACIVCETSPQVGVARAINTLNHLYLGRDTFCKEMRLLKANNVCNLKLMDYFRQMRDVFSDDAVN